MRPRPNARNHRGSRSVACARMGVRGRLTLRRASSSFRASSCMCGVWMCNDGRRMYY